MSSECDPVRTMALPRSSPVSARSLTAFDQPSTAETSSMKMYDLAPFGRPDEKARYARTVSTISFGLEKVSHVK